VHMVFNAEIYHSWNPYYDSNYMKLAANICVPREIQIEQLCLTIWYISIDNGEVIVNDDPLALVDAVTAIDEMYSLHSPIDSDSAAAIVSTYLNLMGQNISDLTASKCKILIFKSMLVTAWTVPQIWAVKSKVQQQ
jgi:hypothetical protein